MSGAGKGCLTMITSVLKVGHPRRVLIRCNYAVWAWSLIPLGSDVNLKVRAVMLTCVIERKFAFIQCTGVWFCFTASLPATYCNSNSVP